MKTTQENTSLSIILAFISSITIVLIIMGISIFICNKFGVDKTITTVITGSYAMSVQLLYNKFEQIFKFKNLKNKYLPTSPTQPFLKMLLLAPIKISSFYIVLILSSAVIISLGILMGYKTPQETMLIGFVWGGFIGLFVPTLMYIFGEWIGRSLSVQSHVFVVAIISGIFTVFVYWFTLNSILNISLLQTNPLLSQLEYGLLVLILVMFFSLFIPLSFGAYRGFKYKVFFDLAYFKDKLPIDKKKDIDEFVAIIAEDYSSSK